MPRKTVPDVNTRARILDVGARLLFENGFDGASIRSIMNAVGANVGAFYYYFGGKDELIHEIMMTFFEPYRADLEVIVNDAHNVPSHALVRFFSYVEGCVRAFRKKYGSRIHPSVRMAIREHSLTVMTPYMESIINTMIQYGAHPSMDTHTTAIFLTHGIGNCLLLEESDWVENAAGDLTRTLDLIMGIDEAAANIMKQADVQLNQVLRQ